MNDGTSALADPIAAGQERLDFVLSAASLGYWEFEPGTRQLLFVSDIYRANWGFAPGEPFNYDTVLRRIHPDDRAMHEGAVKEAIATGGNLDIEYRVIWPDNSVHWLRLRSRATYDKAGKPVRMAGTSFDIPLGNESQA